MSENHESLGNTKLNVGPTSNKDAFSLTISVLSMRRGRSMLDKKTDYEVDSVLSLRLFLLTQKREVYDNRTHCKPVSARHVDVI